MNNHLLPLLFFAGPLLASALGCDSPDGTADLRARKASAPRTLIARRESGDTAVPSPPAGAPAAPHSSAAAPAPHPAPSGPVRRPLPAHLFM